MVAFDQAAEHDGFARTHGDLGGDLALKEAALAGDSVFLAHVGDSLVDFERDKVARIDGRGDVEHDARVFVLDVVGGGDGAAAAVWFVRCYVSCGFFQIRF